MYAMTPVEAVVSLEKQLNWTCVFGGRITRN